MNGESLAPMLLPRPIRLIPSMLGVAKAKRRKVETGHWLNGQQALSTRYYKPGVGRFM